MPKCKPRDKQCLARLTSGEKFKYRPYEGAAFRYKEAQCIKACEDPDSDICKLCEIKERKNMNTGKITVHGRMGGPIPNGSHIEGGPWNLADLERHAREARENAAPATRRKRKTVAAPAVQKKKSVKAAKKSSSSNSSSSNSSSSNSSSSNSNSSSSSSSSNSSSGSSGSSKSSSSRRSLRRRSSSIRRSAAKKMYLPVSRAASASPPRRAPPVYEGWTTPLSNSEKNSENVDVLKRIQEGLNANPKLAPKLD